jgi:hypothetical protein
MTYECNDHGVEWLRQCFAGFSKLVQAPTPKLSAEACSCPMQWHWWMLLDLILTSKITALLSTDARSCASGYWGVCTVLLLIVMSTPGCGPVHS